METLLNRRSVHSFIKADFSPEINDEITDKIKLWDSHACPFQTAPRIQQSSVLFQSSFLQNPQGFAIGSYFLSNNERAVKQMSVDLGFKIYCLSIDLIKLGICNCICSDIDEEKVLKECKKIHTMEFKTPVLLAFGMENKNVGLMQRIKSWVYRDDKRLEISETVRVNDNHIGDLKNILEAVRRAPSSGNIQNWRLLVEKNMVHFYCTSEAVHRYINIGCALGAFYCAVENEGFCGKWEIKENPPDNEGEYVISWVFIEKKKSNKK